MFADDLTFSLPRGIDYVSRNERVHAGSLLAWHPASRALHVDDTINLMPVPRLLRGVFPNPRVFLHPTLPQALLPQAGAVRDFRDWLQGLAGLTRDLRWLCAAHSGLREFEPGQFKGELLAAFRAGGWPSQPGSSLAVASSGTTGMVRPATSIVPSAASGATATSSPPEVCGSHSSARSQSGQPWGSVTSWP